MSEQLDHVVMAQPYNPPFLDHCLDPPVSTGSATAALEVVMNCISAWIRMVRPWVGWVPISKF